MLKRKITKATASVKKFLKSGKNPKKLLMCKVCDTEEVEVSFDIGAVTCARCVQRMVAPPPPVAQKKPEGERFPRGWHFKQRYVHTDGRVFCKGVETGETDTPKVEKKKKVVAKKTPKKKRK